jgi:glycosyltransferase involved in cell wall biosynthesis
MKVAIHLMSPAFGGTEVRAFEVLLRFPQYKYFLLIPRNLKWNLMKSILRLGLKRDYLKVLKNSIELKDFNLCCGTLHRLIDLINYRRYVEKLAERLGADLIYLIRQPSYFYLTGHELSPLRWVQIEQGSLPVGSLVTEEGYGLKLYLKNASLNGISRQIALSSYARLFVSNYLSFLGVENLTVSYSVPYEREKVGIKANFTVIEPGNAVDECPYSGWEKVYDVIFHSRIDRMKGIFDFLIAIKYLTKLRGSIRAVIVGSANEEVAKEVMKYAVNLGVAKNIEFRFNARSDEVLRLLTSAKVFIYPTRYDAFSLAVLESLSCGTPVVAYGIPAIRFNYAKTKAVIKVKPLDIRGLVDKTYELLRSGEWERLSKEGVQFSKRYTWDSVAKSEWNALERIAAKSLQ